MDFLQQLQQIGTHFRPELKVIHAIPFGGGHINSTYYCATQFGAYIVQRINHNVFKSPEKLMNNLMSVTSYLQNRGIETIQYLKTENGLGYVEYDGNYWRAYKYVTDTLTIEKTDDKTMFEGVGAGFGAFAKELADYDASTLHEIIPNFHNTKVRFEHFKKALEDDEFGRASKCEAETIFMLSKAWLYPLVVDSMEAGTVPVRVTHNDTKINNILLDGQTLEPRVVIDLDTIMPGSILYDFGDALRAGTGTAAEDEEDTDKMHFNIDFFESFTKGFLSVYKKILTEREKELLVLAGPLLTLECGMRFLTDYLEHDVYFKVSYKGHNLVRARTQIKLASEMLEKREQMQAIIDKYMGD